MRKPRPHETNPPKAPVVQQAEVYTTPVKQQSPDVPLYLEMELAPHVMGELLAMTSAQRYAFVAEYQRKRKDKGIEILMVILTVHYAWLNRWGWQVLFWLATATCCGYFIWVFIDCFRVGDMVDDYNRDRAAEVMVYVRGMK